MTISAFIAVSAAAATEAGHEAEAAGLPQLDPTWWPSQLAWLAFSFGILYWLMASKFLPAIGAGIEERRDRVADDLDQAAEFRRQSEDAEAAYDRSLADAKAKAQAIAADTRSTVDAEIAELQVTTDKAIEEKLSIAETRIAEMKAEAANKVREASNDITKSVVDALIDETPTEDAVAAALDAVANNRAA
ncbi:MAG: F0F1 ATP synthase subunit B' [Pseudomonadota bacterium]